MQPTFLELKLYNDAGKMPLKTQLLLVLLAAILDVLLMAYWEPPKKTDIGVMFFLPIAITLLALCIYVPIQYIIGLIWPKIHHILQAFLTYFTILCSFMLIMISKDEIDLSLFSNFIQDFIRAFTCKEICGFLNFPAAFFLLILSIIYIIKPPKIAQISSADILDDSI
jgi:hypothetical protein